MDLLTRETSTAPRGLPSEVQLTPAPLRRHSRRTRPISTSSSSHGLVDHAALRTTRRALGFRKGDGRTASPLALAPGQQGPRSPDCQVRQLFSCFQPRGRAIYRPRVRQEIPIQASDSIRVWHLARSGSKNQPGRLKLPGARVLPSLASVGQALGTVEYKMDCTRPIYRCFGQQLALQYRRKQQSCRCSHVKMCGNP